MWGLIYVTFVCLSFILVRSKEVHHYHIMYTAIKYVLLPIAKTLDDFIYSTLNNEDWNRMFVHLICHSQYGSDKAIQCIPLN